MRVALSFHPGIESISVRNPGPAVQTNPGVEQPRTARARAAVVSAALELFVEQGYGATSITRISQRAGVPAATVYRLYPSKVAILKAVLDVAIAGDHDEVSVASRPRVRDALADPSPRGRIAGFVAVVVAINGRIGDLYQAITTAAETDPQARELLAQITGQRGQGQRSLVQSLVESDFLAVGLSESRAADVVHALMSPELYRLLVTDRGWTPEAYAQWLINTLTAQLLPPTA